MKSILRILFISMSFTFIVSAQNGGYAVKFDGVDGGASMTMNTGNTNSTATFEMWFTQLTAQAGTQYLGDLHSISGSDKRRVMPYLTNSAIGIYCAPNTGDENNAVTQSTGITASTNVWYHIAVTINGSAIKMYVNGKLFVNTSLTDTYSLTGTEVLTIAKDYWNTTYANIKVDEVRIWSSERTEAEIKGFMFKELAGTEAGLLSYYKMSDGSGAQISSNQFTGTYNGTATGGYNWVASGAFAGSRNSLNFDRADDNVDCGNGANVTFNGVQNFTVEAWVYPISANWGAVVSKFQHSAAHDGYSLEVLPDSKLAILYGNNWADWNILQSTKALTLNTWHHIAATYNGSTFKIYIDGRLEGSAVWTNGITDPGTNLYIGARMGPTVLSTFFDGNIDEVRVWGTARSEAEIKETMCRTLVGNETNLRAYYRLDEADGTTAYDLSSNAYNGTLTNMDPATDRITSDAFNTWIGGESSVWSNGGNWSKGTAPGTGNNVGIYKWALGNEASITTSPELYNLLISSTSSPALNSSLTVNGNLILEKNFNLNSQTITLGSSANLVEGSGRLYGSLGTISTTRNLNNITALDVAGLGAKITTAADMGSTTITRGHTQQTGNDNISILRYYDIVPTNNSALNATLVFNYNDAELNGLTESNFVLYKSTNSGTNWYYEGGTVSTDNNNVTKSGIAGFSRWTIGDSSSPMSGPPDTPVATAATSVGSTSFSANWNAASGATKYYLDVSTVNTFATFVAGYNDLDVGNVVTYSVTGLTPGVTYHYRVRAYNTSGTSASSNTITVNSSITAPVAVAPTSIGETTLNANWNASSGATGYYLDVATNDDFTTFVTGFSNKNVGNVITYTVTGLTGSTTYYYRIRAFSTSITSANSNTIEVLTVPASPIAISSSAITNTGFTANWNLSNGATGYRIDLATNDIFTNFVGGYNNFDAGNVDTYSFAGLNSNTVYYFRVRAYNGSGSSVNSQTLSEITSAEKPVLAQLESDILDYVKKQSALTVTNTLTVQSPATSPIVSAEIVISGNYVKGEDKLQFTSSNGVAGSWDAETGKLYLAGSLTAENYQSILRTVKIVITTLQPSHADKEISFTVNNSSFNSNTVIRKISVTTTNLPPELSNLESTTLYYLKGITPLRLQITDSTIVEDNDNMYLYGATVRFTEGYIHGQDYIDCNNTSFLTGIFNKETGTLLISGKSTPANFQAFIRELTYRNSSQSSATNSKKKVEFFVNDGLVNSNILSRNLEVNLPVNTPTDLTAAIISNKVELNWLDNSIAEQGQIIERSETVNTNFTEIARIGADITSYSDLNIVNGRKYFYRIAAYYGSLVSSYSNEVSVTGIVVGIADMNGIPKSFVVSQNYPNPFNPSTVIVYSLPNTCKVKIQIFNSLGQLIDDLVDDTKSAGYHNVKWNAGKLPSGIYLCRILAISLEGNNQFIDSKRMMLIK